MTAFPLRIYDPATDQWYDICTGAMGPAGPTGPAGPAGSLPDGVIGDLLWYDGHSWLGLHASGDPGDVLTLTTSGPDLVPVYAGPAGSTIQQQHCGAAQRVAAQIERAYNWLAQQVLVSAQMSLHNETGLDTLITELTAVFIGVFDILVAAATTVVEGIGTGDYLSAARGLGPLTPGQSDALISFVYCTFEEAGSSLTFTEDIRSGIKAKIDAYPNWIGTDQPAFLKTGLDFLPLENWQTWTDQGASVPTNACTGYDCGLE